jgi:hypothetical protein
MANFAIYLLLSSGASHVVYHVSLRSGKPEHTLALAVLMAHGD